MHIEHINICAPMELLVKTKDFYCGLFDLVEGYRPDFSRAGFWLYSGDKPLIHLTESDTHQANPERGYFDHVAFQVTGLSKMISRLRAQNVEYRLARIPEIGMTQIFLSDPAGTGVEANFIEESVK